MRFEPVSRGVTVCVAAAFMAFATAGCQQKAAADSAPPAAAASADAPPAGGACRLLKRGEVSDFFPGAKAGEVDTSRQQYGISACIWDTERSRFVAQYWKAVGGSAKDEAQGLMLGVLDPLKSGSQHNVRYEDVPGLGEQAVAVVEAKDDQRGVLNDFAMLVVQHGDQILVLMGPELARVERAKALEALTSLGKSSVARL